MIPGSTHLPGSPGPAGNTLNTNKKKAREFLVRVLYVEMLGHDGSFGYIKAVVSVVVILILYELNTVGGWMYHSELFYCC